MSTRSVPRAVHEYAGDAATAFRQAPLEVAVGVVTAVAFSVALRQGTEEEWLRIAAPAALSLPLLLGLSVLRVRGALGVVARWGASAAVLLAAAAYGLWVFDPERQSEGFRFLALLGAAAMAVSLVPAVGVADHDARRLAFWRFNARLLARIATVVAYGGALFAALAGAVAAVTSLFDLDTPEHLYADLGGAVFFALVPWVVVGGIPELVAPAEGDEQRAPRAVGLLGRYLYAPVLAVYLAILLAYAVKVVTTGEAPKNLLSPIILLAGLFGFLGSTLLEPLRHDGEYDGVSRMIRILPVPLLALLPFGLWAVWVRRDQYGWTEFRYLRFALLVALGVLAVMGTVRLVRRREPLLLLVPLVLGAALLLSAVGPWGASAVSRRSQQARLRAGLEEAGLLANGRVSRGLAPPRAAPRDSLPVSAESYERISSGLGYLYDNHGAGSVQPYFPVDVAVYESGYGLTEALGLLPGCEEDASVRYASAMLPGELPIPGLPAGTLYRLGGTRQRPPTDTTSVHLAVADSGVVVTFPDTTGGWRATADLRPLLTLLAGRGGDSCRRPTVTNRDVQLSAEQARRPLVDAAGVVVGEAVLTHVAAERPEVAGDSLREFRLERVDALVVVSGR